MTLLFIANSPTKWPDSMVNGTRRYQLKCASPNTSTTLEPRNPIAGEAGFKPPRFRALCVRPLRRDAGLADDRRRARLPGVEADAQRGVSGLHRPGAVPAV